MESTLRYIPCSGFLENVQPWLSVLREWTYTGVALVTPVVCLFAMYSGRYNLFHKTVVVGDGH